MRDWNFIIIDGKFYLCVVAKTWSTLFVLRILTRYKHRRGTVSYMYALIALDQTE